MIYVQNYFRLLPYKSTRGNWIELNICNWTLLNYDSPRVYLYITLFFFLSQMFSLLFRVFNGIHSCFFV